MKPLLVDAALQRGGGGRRDQWRVPEAGALDRDPGREGGGDGLVEDWSGRVLSRAEGDGRVLVLDVPQGFECRLDHRRCYLRLVVAVGEEGGGGGRGEGVWRGRVALRGNQQCLR